MSLIRLNIATCGHVSKHLLTGHLAVICFLMPWWMMAPSVVGRSSSPARYAEVLESIANVAPTATVRESVASICAAYEREQKALGDTRDALFKYIYATSSYSPPAWSFSDVDLTARQNLTLLHIESQAVLLAIDLDRQLFDEFRRIVSDRADCIDAIERDFVRNRAMLSISGNMCGVNLDVAKIIASMASETSPDVTEIISRYKVSIDPLLRDLELQSLAFRGEIEVARQAARSAIESDLPPEEAVERMNEIMIKRHAVSLRIRDLNKRTYLQLLRYLNAADRRLLMTTVDPILFEYVVGTDDALIEAATCALDDSNIAPEKAKAVSALLGEYIQSRHSKALDGDDAYLEVKGREHFGRMTRLSNRMIWIAREQYHVAPTAAERTVSAAAGQWAKVRQAFIMRLEEVLANEGDYP